MKIVMQFIVVYSTSVFGDIRFPSDATSVVGQRKPFDSVQMTASSK